ncbi:MAG: multidrug efflux RND transporter permease subunit [Isosphaeraceae bacterium]|nr:multidrug efflux RND transporter permease subunit [Isosphaeraceae bacterium]
MFSQYFIDRPIFASVLSIVITLAGSLAVFALPIAQYPDITPPTVEVSAVFAGANARVVADTVASPIEQQVNGVENMLYMSSQCTNDGVYTLTITFKIGVDLNVAQVLVQNRVALAEPILPDLVKRRGVSVKKKSPSILMIVNLFSPDGSRDNLYLSNYATIQIRDELSRLTGVGDTTYLGQRDYSMRLWLDPGKMAARGLSASDVLAAVQQQNAQVAAGQIGQPPVPAGQVFQYTMSTKGRLIDVDEFEEMILRADASGRVVRLRDVARLELGAQAYDQTCLLDGRPSVALSIYQRPGSNALETARLVREKMEELRSQFPKGVEYAIAYDTTPFIRESVDEVVHTLRDAVLLVAFVVLLFLQNWRSAVIPLVAVPVAIVGTFAVMASMGFSLNNLTLFGLVLAIGIVVDDAIVVVEAVEHHIEGGAAPREATSRAMREVSGPVVAIGLVLAAVFLPCAFISGIVGQFFSQFALTIAASTLISTFNSLTLSPALAALLLRPKQSTHRSEPLPSVAHAGLFAWASTWLPASISDPAIRYFESVGLSRAGSEWVILGTAFLVGLLGSRILNRLLAWCFRGFNTFFGHLTEGYVRITGGLLRRSVSVILVYGGLLYATYLGLTSTPTGFIPLQDKGYLLVDLRMPDSTALEKTQATIARLEERARSIPGIQHTLSGAGQSLLLGANAPNFGSIYVILDPFESRTKKGLDGRTIAARLQDALDRETSDGMIGVYEAPPVEGLGTAGGFRLILEDRSDLGAEVLQSETDRIVEAAAGSTVVGAVGTSFRARSPWLHIEIDRELAKTLGVSMNEVFDTLQVYLGSLYINDFNRFGRTWQVNIQADSQFRRRVEDLKLLRVRNDVGRMIPFGGIASFREASGPVMIQRYNMYESAAVNGTAALGVSSGEVLDAMDRIVSKELIGSMRAEWTELALLQRETGNSAMYAFGLAVVLVFLVLAAQYESWALPLAVILVVPMCLLCSVIAVIAAELDVNIFTQVGFIVLIGLACKNAILIVEFAKAKRELGSSRREATLEACRLRLRPIVMTSLAFILGVVPLVLSSGAGAEMRRSLGTAVFGGMLGVTLFGIFLTPVFFYGIQWIVDRSRVDAAEPSSSDAATMEAREA